MADRPRRTSLFDVLLGHPSVDLAIGLVVGFVLWAARLSHHHDPLSTMDNGGRQVAYYTISTAAAALLGFGVTAMAIFVALVPGARMRRLLDHHALIVRKTFASTIRVLALLTLFGVLGAIADVSTHYDFMRLVIYVLLVMAVLRVARMLWLFSALVTIGTRDRDEGTADEANTPMNLL